MKHVFAIGGGEIGRPGYPVETLPIDTALIKSTGKKHPRLLFIPTASRDSTGYTTVVEEHFGKRLGCTVDTLCVAKGAPSQKEMRAKVAAADIVYVGGGNTLFMMKRWRACGLDTILSRAAESGTVMSGLSAGAVCWFRFASSDSRMMSDPTYKKYIRVRGLGWYNATLSPHHIRESTRDEGLKTLLRARGGIGIALDDCACLEIRGTQYRIITSQPQARARKVYVRRGKVVEELLKKDTWSDCLTLFS